MNKPLRILNVEDREDDTLLLQLQLEKQGIPAEFTRVDNRVDYTAALTQSQWDLIIADYNVPSFDAPRAIAELKKLKLDVPFIVVSGVVGEEAAVELMRAGASDYISKDNLTRLGPAIKRELQEAGNRASRLKAEEALRESESLLRGLLLHSPSLICVQDLRGRYLIWNPAFEQTFEVPRGLFHERPNEVMDVDFASTLEFYRHKVLTSNEPCQFEAQAVMQGERKHFWVLQFPTFGAAGVPEAICTMATDITERRNSEEALRRSEKAAATGRLAAALAHEVNNPLTAVNNALYILQHHAGVQGEVAGYVDVAARELQRVIYITKQILAFYKEGSTPTAFDLARTLDETIALFHREISGSALVLKSHCPDRLEATGYVGEIRQVLINLIANAIEASSTGGRLSIKISRSRCWRTGRLGVRISIGDNGTGIRPEHRSRLFEPFFSTKQEKGAGLGLWVSQGIIAKHEGSIRVKSRCDSQERHGTVISVFLPGVVFTSTRNGRVMERAVS